MRFECESCHAKYKISDEKVAGRVVRFPCRKCDHKILIDGRQDDITVPAGPAYGYGEVVTRPSERPSSSFVHEAATARARRPSSPPRRRPSSIPPRRPSSVARRLSSTPAATTALVGQHPGLAPPVPAPAAVGAAKPDVPEWHVSINDVPVGPIRLEELAHKVDAGAVSEYSLVWREGFEEWRPLATVPGLMSLLYERRASGPPARSSFSSMPPFVETRTSVTPAPEPAVVPTPPKPPPEASRPGPPDIPADVAPLADQLQPENGLPPALSEMSQPPAPLGPEPIFQSGSQSGAFSGFPASPDEPVSIPATPPEGAVVAEPRRGTSPWVWAMLVAVAVFSGVVAVLAFERYGDALLKDFFESANALPQVTPSEVVTPSGAEPVEAPPPAEETAMPEEAEAADPADAVAEQEGADEPDVAGAEEAAADDPEPLVEPPKPAEDGPAVKPVKPRRRARVKSKSETTESVGIKRLDDDSLSAEEEKLLADFGSSGEATPAKIDVKESGSTQSKRKALDDGAVRATVTTNKPRLQRCYERAIRGQQSPPAVRMDVSIVVLPSGRVGSVNAAGTGPGGLKECIEASVRRWRFPASSEGGPAQFPIVFSAN